MRFTLNTPTLEIELATQPIELCKLLKAADLVGGGGEAKIVISEGYVYLNGELETQKRKKIYHNDIVEFNGEILLVVCHSPVVEKDKKKASQKANNQTNTQAKTKSSSKKQKQIKPNAPQPIGKRKPINF